MSDLRDLYQEVILDHGRNPRNFHALENPTCSLEGYNPLCGDKLTLYLKLDGDRIEEISFEGAGCAISTASASLLSEMLVGKTREDVSRIFASFHAMVTGEPGQAIDMDVLGKLAVFQGVCEYPARVKCASLSWHTLNAALDGASEPITTE